MRNEGNSLRALYDIANAKAMEQSAQSDQRIAALRTQLADAVGQLAEMAPISERQSARQQTEAARVSPATTNTLALSIAAHMRHATEHCRALSSCAALQCSKLPSSCIAVCPVVVVPQKNLPPESQSD